MRRLLVVNTEGAIQEDAAQINKLPLTVNENTIKCKTLKNTNNRIKNKK